jgi:hypothetical protein
MTTVFTAITLLPYRISSIWRILNDIDRECSSILMYWVLIFMVMLNSVSFSSQNSKNLFLDNQPFVNSDDIASIQA